jgi:hypothetical protein
VLRKRRDVNCEVRGTRLLYVIPSCKTYRCQQWFLRDVTTLIHFVVSLTTGPQPFPKPVLHRVRSSASCLNCQYPLFSLNHPVAAYVFFLVSRQFYPSDYSSFNNMFKKAVPMQCVTNRVNLSLFLMYVGYFFPRMCVILFNVLHNRSNWSYISFYNTFQNSWLHNHSNWNGFPFNNSYLTGVSIQLWYP